MAYEKIINENGHSGFGFATKFGKMSLEEDEFGNNEGLDFKIKSRKNSLIIAFFKYL